MDIFHFDFTKSYLVSEFKTLGWRPMIIHFCTAIGAWGGFPDPPLWWSDLVNSSEWIKWLLLSVLIFQGGDEQEYQMALEFTLILYLLYQASNHIYKFFKPCKNNKKKITNLKRKKESTKTKTKTKIQTKYTKI